MATLGCGTNRAYAYKFPGTTLEGEFKNASDVRWTRIRDDISTAQVTVPTNECCELLNTIKCVTHELHIYRDGRSVWEGPITRIEFSRDTTTIFAQDMVWWAVKTVLNSTQDYKHPHVGIVPQVMKMYLDSYVFKTSAGFSSDYHNMKDRVHWVKSPDEPKTGRFVLESQMTVWDDFDAMAKNSGADYSTLGRDIYVFDTHLRWKTLPTLTTAVLGGWPQVTEYGSEMANQVWFSNSTGFAMNYYDGSCFSQIPAMKQVVVEMLFTSTAENSGNPPVWGTPAYTSMQKEFTQLAKKNQSGRCPAPTRVWLPSGTKLLPTAPVDIQDLIPGAWTLLSTSGDLCRKVAQWQKLNQVEVSETPGDGETVAITLDTAPSLQVLP